MYILQQRMTLYHNIFPYSGIQNGITLDVRAIINDIFLHVLHNICKSSEIL